MSETFGQLSGRIGLAIIKGYIEMLEAGHIKEGLRMASKEETEFGIALLQAVAADIEAKMNA